MLGMLLLVDSVDVAVMSLSQPSGAGGEDTEDNYRRRGQSGRWIPDASDAKRDVGERNDVNKETEVCRG